MGQQKKNVGLYQQLLGKSPKQKQKSDNEYTIHYLRYYEKKNPTDKELEQRRSEIGTWEWIVNKMGTNDVPSIKETIDILVDNATKSE